MISRRDAPPWVKEAGRSVTRTAGRASAGARMLPGVLLVGTQRGGTTSLFRTLTEHPGIAQPVFHKGVHYFDVNYRRGMRWYRGHFPLRAAARRRAGEACDRPLAFESAGYYMHHPLAPYRIAEDLPGVKLLVVLRDPVERAYSAHKHELARGFETEPFERALELEPQRLAGEVERIRAEPDYLSHAHRHNSYVDRGHYVEQLEVLFDLFGRKRVHVAFAEDIFVDPESGCHAILDFLGLPRRPPTGFTRHNARPSAPMPPSVRSALADHFTPYDERLATVLGEVPPWRR